MLYEGYFNLLSNPIGGCLLLNFSFSRKAGNGVEIVVLVASVSDRQRGTRVWSAVAVESAAMECTGMFGSAEMVSGCAGMALALA